MATLLNTNIRGEQIANTTISGVHIVNASIAPVKTDVYNSPTDGDVLTYKSSTSQFEWNSIGTMVVNEVPTGSINGANTTFTLSDTPVGNTLEVNLNGILQEPGSGNDYTVAGTTITFTTAPETGDIILCSYLVSAGLGGGVYTDHGNLDGLGDDDHLQYIKADGSRAFTGVVAGITPTIAAHVSTKGYVDGEINSHVHDASDVTAGTFADARIAQSNVTQHEAAINHNSLTNTHNLTTSIDHDTITNHHNLTTDIDHNQLTNYAVGEHRTINDSGSDVTDLWSADKISSEIASASGTTDHGALTGLADDDHTQYLLANGSRGLSADWDAGAHKITAADIDISTMTSGSVLYIGSSGEVKENNNAFYFEEDNSYGKLAIGDIASMRNTFQAVREDNITNMNNVKALISTRNKGTTNNNYTGFAAQTLDTSGNVHSGTRLMTKFTSHTLNAVSADMIFETRHAGTRSEKMKISSDGKVSLLNGTGINEFSTDTTLSGVSDDAVPTELAVKTYVDNLMQSAENTDIDTGTETVDTFADTAGDGCVWHFVVKNGTNLRTGQIMSCWDSSNNVEYTESSTNSLGNTAGLTLVVDISSNNVRLRATASSDNWSVKVVRVLM